MFYRFLYICFLNFDKMDNFNKKYKTPDSIISKVEEPTQVYRKIVNQSQVDSEAEWNEMPDVLKKLLEKGIKESEQGLGISHEEMMKKVKAKYPFINGI
jgi:hypothetical protein